MIKEIIKDKEILKQISKRATKKDFAIIQDLIDTIEANKERCVGLAAIQINQPVKIVVAFYENKYISLINPAIINHGSVSYMAEESCMSFEGISTVKRYDRILVMHEVNGKFIKQAFKGILAQIIQHECDHLVGKLI